MVDFKTAIAEVKLAYDIVDYIQQGGVRLKNSGPNKWKGLCPFHNEKTPSFTVDDHFQNYRCFGCGAHGDLLQFVQQTEQLDFFESLKKLAEDKNIKLDIKEEHGGVDYTSLREAMRVTSNFFYSEYRKLSPDHPARQEVTNRGLSEKAFLYGYAPEGRRQLYEHLKKNGFSDETILLTGACIQFEGKPAIFDFWHGRLMFFITDITGKPIGWSGRKLYETDNRGKYVNSRDSILFDKGASLFHISQAKKKASEVKTVYVAEGQFDVAALAETGLTNTVASSGTAFTEKQGLMLRRLVGEEGHIVFCFDGDEAGVKAAVKVFKNVASIHSQAYAIPMPENVDPCDLRLKNGDEALREYFKAKVIPLLEFVLNSIQKNFDLTNEFEKTKFIESAARVLKTVSNNILRETYTKKVSLDSFTSIEVIKAAVEKAEPLNSEVRQASENEAGTSTKNENPVVEKTEELTFEEIWQRVLEDEQYGLSARLLTLALNKNVDTELLDGIKGLIPPDFLEILDEIAKLPPDQPVIAELFSQSALAGKLIANNFFPFLHIMDEETLTGHFIYLTDRLKNQHKENLQNQVKGKVARVLQNSPEQGAAFLKKALEAEERGFAKVSGNL